MELFRSEEITLDLLPEVTEAQLQRIGVRTLGQRMRIVRSAQNQLEIKLKLQVKGQRLKKLNL